MTRVSSWRSLLRKTPLRGGLGRRTLLWFLVLSLVPLLVSNTVGYVFTREIIDRQIRRYLRALAETQAQQVAAEVERHQLFLDGITVSDRALFQTIPAAAPQTPWRQDRSLEALQVHLDHELMELRSLTELFVIDSTGTVVVATDSSRLGQDWSLSELYRRGRVEHYFAADWETRNENVVPVYRLAVPIRDGQQRLTGVLGGTGG